jgi:type IV pilus assembly protein PilM
MNLKVCIDIGSKFIKIVEGYEKKGKIFIRKIEKVENPLENFRKVSEDEAIEKVGNFLREYLKKIDIKGKYCLFTVSGEDLISYYFQLPDLPEEELENAVKFETVHILPESIENYDYDYISLPLNGKKNITLVAFPKRKTKIYLDIFSKCKLKPLIMETSSSSILNSFLFFKKEDLFAILNIGYTISNLSIFLKDKFVFLRDIMWGSKVIGDIEESNIEVIREKTDDLIEEINMSLKYFEHHTEKTIEKLYITGGGSILPGLQGVLKEKTELQLEVYNPLLYLQNNLIPLEIKEKGIFFTSAFGLLIRKIL